jgi:hypothetical protein
MIVPVSKYRVRHRRELELASKALDRKREQDDKAPDDRILDPPQCFEFLHQA